MSPSNWARRRCAREQLWRACPAAGDITQAFAKAHWTLGKSEILRCGLGRRKQFLTQLTTGKIEGASQLPRSRHEEQP